MVPKIVGFVVHVIFFGRCSDGKMYRLGFIINVIALAAVRCSLVLMFENSLVFDVVTVLYELSCIVR